MSEMAAAAVGGGIDLAGTGITNIVNASSARHYNKQQLDLASTAHQREVADLRAAGLNPILSAMGGKGAPMPDMQQFRAEDPQLHMGDRLVNAINAKYANQQSRAEREVKEATKELIDQQTQTQVSQEAANSALAYKTWREADNIDMMTFKNYQDAMLSSALAKKEGINTSIRNIDLMEARIKKTLYESLDKGGITKEAIDFTTGTLQVLKNKIKTFGQAKNTSGYSH